MRTNPKTSIALASLLLAAAAGAQELYSVNLWSIGKPSASIWVSPDPNYPTNQATLTIEPGETAGVWPTDVWDNIAVNTISTATINGSEGGTATLKVLQKRNQGPYNWTTLRDGSSAVTVDNQASMNDGNATLLDGHLNGTETDGGSAPLTPNRNIIIEVSGLTLPVYDVIIYFGINSAQAFSRNGFINFNGGGVTTFTLPAGQPGATLDEIESGGATGNYIKYSNIAGASFTATIYGDDFTHLGPAGIQIREVEAVVGPVDPAVSTVAASPVLVPADGTSTSTVTVTLKDAIGLPVAGKQVTLAGNPGTATIAPPTAVTTDLAGVATFTVKSNTPGTEVFTATDVTDGNLVITQTAGVKFTGPGSAAQSTVAAAHASAVANGTTATTITVNLKDANGFPVQGKDITLAGSPGSAVIIPAAPVTTDASGVAAFSVSSSTVNTVVFTATDTTDSVTITQTASVNFLDAATPLAINFNVYNSAGTPVQDDPATLTGPAGGLGETWNQSNAVAATNLLCSTGVLTGVGINCNASGRWAVGNPADTLKLLRAGAANFDKTITSVITITGLPPDSFFDVFLASARTDGVETNNGTWSTTNETTSPGSQAVSNIGDLNGNTWQHGNNYVLFEKVKANGGGEITFSGVSGAYRLFLNGVQLVPTDPPLARITSFGIPGWPGVINQTVKTISLTVPTGTNLATLAPTFTLYSGTCNQTSGAPPSPTFAVGNPTTYTVTDTSTEPDTVNTYTVTVAPIPAVGSLVINLGTSPSGTTINGGTFIGSIPPNLPLPTLPAGSILRSLSANTKLEATDAENFASDLAVLLDPTPATPGGDFSLEITNGEVPFGAAVPLDWPASADDGVGTVLADTKTDASWAAVAPIDLATTGLFLGNAYGGPTTGGTWSGTITLTYDVQGGGSAYQAWAGTGGFDSDKNGDGVANGLAFLLGAANPDADAVGLLPDVRENSGGLVLTFSVLNRDHRGPALASLQWSNDLGQAEPWSGNSAPVPETTSVVNGVSFQVTPNGNFNDVVATIPATEAAAGKLFGRLSAAEN